MIIFGQPWKLKFPYLSVINIEFGFEAKKYEKIQGWRGPPEEEQKLMN